VLAKQAMDAKLIAGATDPEKLEMMYHNSFSPGRV